MHPKNHLHFCKLLLSIAFAGLVRHGYAQAPFFSPAASLSVEQGSGVIIKDFNRDGFPDLLTKHDNMISVRNGDGKGNFMTQGSPQTLACQPGSLISVDVNADGIPDLGMTTKQNDEEMVCIYIGHSSGIFEIAPGSPFVVSPGISSYKPSLRFADLNEDGKMDLIASNERRNTLHICIGDGTGRFSSPSVVTLDPGRWTYSFEVADINGDHHLDLVTTSGMMVSDDTPGRLFVRRGNGKATFAEPDHKKCEVSADPKLGTIADLNGDKHPDLVLIHGRDNVLTTLINDGQGGFNAGKQVPVKMTAFTVVATDVNMDKRMDMVAATVDSRNAPYPSRFEILIGDGLGGLRPDENSAFRAAHGSYRFAMDDLNRDGKSDIVISSFGSGRLEIMYGR